MKTRNQRAFTFSSFLNAWTLYEGNKQLGIKTRTTDPNLILPIPQSRLEGNDHWLQFTEENSLRKALCGELAGKFWPKTYPMEFLDDKWAFAQWLEQKVGLTKSLRCWSLADFRGEHSFPLMVKAKHSWLGGVKLPRGWVCRNANDLERSLSNLVESGYSQDCFFLQEWLGDGPMRLLSVCGFFDAQDYSRNLTCVAERVADYNEGPSCSAAVVTVCDPSDLTQRTFAILNELSYVGPFELEFIIVQDQVLVLELNPLFWMQHGIFLPDGNGLLKRYFELDSTVDRHMTEVSHILWVDCFWLLSRLFALDPIIFRLFWNWIVNKGYRLFLCPYPSFAIYVRLKKFPEKLKRALAFLVSRITNSHFSIK